MSSGARPPSDSNLPRPDSHADTVASEPAATPSESAPGAIELDAATLEDAGFAARYEIGGLIGRGGMGEVHVCRDLRIGRRVAVKRMHQGSGSSGSAQAHARFLREGRIQAQLEHPSVVPVYDLGRSADGAEFFTMKRVRGRTLAEVFEDLRAGDADAVRDHSRRKLLTAFSSICLAVHYAHARGVLHRDLKPANVMLGTFGEVYVLDWGLAKVAGDAEQAEERIDAARDAAGATVAGSILGTPGYAAPEALQGRGADARGDVYALGAILFEMLALEPLHAPAAVTAMIAATLTGVDARASLRAPEREVPPELEALCVRATALRPEARPASALELHQAIERFLDGDRDLALRREHSRRHAEAAEAAAARALGADAPIAERQRALADVGRALALDPDNRAAAATLMRLLTTAPRELPPEAEQALRRAEEQNLRSAARLGSLAYLAAVLLSPLTMAMGVRSWTATLICVALMAAAAGLSWALSRLSHPGTAALLAILVISTAAMASTATMFGAYIILPTLVTANTMAFAAHLKTLRAGVIVLIGALGVAVPASLQALHLLPPSYQFADGVIRVLPFGMSFPAPATELLLLFFTLASVAGASAFAVHAQRARAQAEQRLQLHAWQLSQLVADQSRQQGATVSV